MTRLGDRVTVRADVDGDGYPGFAREAFHLVVHGALPRSTQLDGARLGMTDDHVVVPNAGEPFLLELDV